jgi:hypothetical protein
VAVNLTVSLDDDVVKHARKVARSLGKSLNQLVREYLESLTVRDDAEREIEELRRLSVGGKGRSRKWRFNRDELHART